MQICVVYKLLFASAHVEFRQGDYYLCKLKACFTQVYGKKLPFTTNSIIFSKRSTPSSYLIITAKYL